MKKHFIKLRLVLCRCFIIGNRVVLAMLSSQPCAHLLMTKTIKIHIFFSVAACGRGGIHEWKFVLSQMQHNSQVILFSPLKRAFYSRLVILE